MGIDHSNPYIHSTTVLCDNEASYSPYQIRVSSHCLAIETGRYHKPTSLPVDQRLCSECGVLEDEVHFLCDCVHYSFLREDLFSVAIPYFPEF